VTSPAGSPVAIAVNPIDRLGRTRDQAAAPPYLSMISGQTLRVFPEETGTYFFRIMR
jgi:Ser/Thr protein kinase RdoA (MazF antagonist)